LVIGARNSGSKGLQGAMDDVRIYKTALGAEDIMALAALPPPPAPVLKTPADLATGVSNVPLLGWEPVPGAISYQLQVSEDAGFSNPAFEQNGMTDIGLPVTLNFNTTSFWRVRAPNP